EGGALELLDVGEQVGGEVTGVGSGGGRGVALAHAPLEVVLEPAPHGERAEVPLGGVVDVVEAAVGELVQHPQGEGGVVEVAGLDADVDLGPGAGPQGGEEGAGEGAAGFGQQHARYLPPVPRIYARCDGPLRACAT